MADRKREVVTVTREVEITLAADLWRELDHYAEQQDETMDVVAGTFIMLGVRGFSAAVDDIRGFLHQAGAVVIMSHERRQSS